MKRYALIVAGGSGSRMNSSIAKQFIELNGKPILMRTIDNFFRFDPSLTIILVLPKEQLYFWQILCEKHHFSIKHQVVAGGETRFQSVKNGLALITEEGIVAIHDGVRPLVSHATILRCFDVAAKWGNAIPCLPVYETVRHISNGDSALIDRNALRFIQTPQVFSSALIKSAFEQPYEESFTDDASVLEKTGEKIQLVEGNRENIKITEPLDLIIAEAFMRQQEN
jgi:2-C-methyl-D-erythritol 4-phosphate cytidylyltransferase